MSVSHKTSKPHLFSWVRFGPAGQVDDAEADTSTGALWETLRRDRVALLALAALSSTVLLAAAAALYPRLAWFAVAAELARPLLVVVVIRSGLSRIIHRDERRFWNEMALAFLFWFLALALAAAVGILGGPARGSAPALFLRMVEVILYSLSFLALVIAVERPMKRRRGLHAANFGPTLTWSGGTVFVFGLFFYFIVIPIAINVTAEMIQVPSFYMYLVLEIYVVSKLIYYGSVTESQRWQVIYALLVLVMLGIFMVDFLETLVATKRVGISFIRLSSFAWALPYLGLLVAVRLRHHPFPSEESLFDSVSRKDPLPWPRERLVTYALVFPLIHFFFYSFGIFDDAGQPAREAFVVLWLLLFGTLAFFQQRILEKKARDWWRERMRAEEALHKSEETLRLVNERREAEEALRKSEEMFDKAFRAIPDAMLISTLAEGRILEVNDSFQRQFGYEREAVLGKTGVESSLWVEPEDRAMMTNILRERGMVRNLEFELIQKTGEKRQTLLSAEVIDLEGETCLLMVLRDISELKRLEESLRRARRFESIGNLASSIAHDLKLLLTPIANSVRVLHEAPLERRYEPFLSSLEENVKRGAGMVEQILTFAGQRDERLSFQPRHLIEELERQAAENLPDSVELKVSIPEEPWAVEGDAGQLHQVLLHLYDNARDAMDEGPGTLSIEAENIWMDKFYARRHLEAQAGPYVVVTMTDTGGGIDPGLHGRIFEPSFTTKESTGLGLAISRMIVEDHGGFMTIYSEVGSGTSVQAYLPAVPAPSGEERKAPPELPAGQGECILVVDDDASICDILRETLQAFGYRALSAYNGAEAVELYREHYDKVDLVLLDMIMPVMDGRTTVEKLAEIDRRVEVVAVSGLATKAEIEKHDNVRIFLEKPYTAEKLLTTLRDLLA